MRWLLVLLVACGGRQPVREPAPTVKQEVDLAERAEKKRQHDVARVHYERAVAIAHDPASSAYAHRELAETLSTWGEYSAAIAHYEASLALVEDASAWHNLGMLRHNQGDVPGAIAALEKARALAPEDPRPRVSLGVIRWKSGDLAGALAEYKALLALELPDKLKDKVQWAIGELSARVAKP
jgi:tetratricopeptide (TPR) repeat protein